MPGSPDIDRLVHVLAALADPIRLRIVALIAERARTGVEVAGALGVSQALACHHLTRLAECGLVIQRREGHSKSNALNRALFEQYLAQVQLLAGSTYPDRG